MKIKVGNLYDITFPMKSEKFNHLCGIYKCIEQVFISGVRYSKFMKITPKHDFIWTVDKNVLVNTNSLEVKVKQIMIYCIAPTWNYYSKMFEDVVITGNPLFHSRMRDYAGYTSHTTVECDVTKSCLSKTLLWLLSSNSPNKSCILYKLPPDLSRQILCVYLDVL